MTVEEEMKILEEINKEIIKQGRLLYSYEIRAILDKFIIDTDCLDEDAKQASIPYTPKVDSRAEYWNNIRRSEKCDRCGALYNPYDYQNNREAWRYSVLRDNHPYEETKLNLCYNCLFDLEKWLKEGGTE